MKSLEYQTIYPKDLVIEGEEMKFTSVDFTSAYKSCVWQLEKDNSEKLIANYRDQFGVYPEGQRGCDPQDKYKFVKDGDVFKLDQMEDCPDYKEDPESRFKWDLTGEEGFFMPKIEDEMDKYEKEVKSSSGE